MERKTGEEVRGWESVPFYSLREESVGERRGERREESCKKERREHYAIDGERERKGLYFEIILYGL